MQREPILKAATLVSIVAAILSLLVAYGVPITEAQQDAWQTVAVLLAPFVVWGIARWKTTPVSDPRDDTGTKLVRAGDGFDAVRR